MALDTTSYIMGKKAGGGGGGTTDYSALSNKPKINNVELSGNKSSSDLSLQDTLVSGTNIKTINNTSLLGSGDITIGGGSAKYIINVNDDISGNFSNYNTTANKAVLQDIYDNFNDITADDVCIYGIDTNRYYAVVELMYFYNILRIRTSTLDAGVTDMYGINYDVRRKNELNSTFTSDVVGDINYSKSEFYGVDKYDTSGLAIGANNTTAYTPTGDYNPATKKYVDDAIGTALSSSY